jgi:hypothetical protein
MSTWTRSENKYKTANGEGGGEENTFCALVISHKCAAASQTKNRKWGSGGVGVRRIPFLRHIIPSNGISLYISNRKPFSLLKKENE